jgi:hypothetical protein
MVRRGSKNEHQKGWCLLEEIGLHAHDMLIIFNSTINIIREDLVYDHRMSIRFFTLKINEVFNIQASKIM